MSDEALARRALKLLDLTDLGDGGLDQDVDALCTKALDPRGPVAAVCVWPRFVSRARKRLEGTGVAVSTVVNFPSGEEDLERVVEDAQGALHDGATEIDLVMPYAALLRGDLDPARGLIEAVRDVVDGGRRLKVILETGALGSPGAIAAASRLAIEAGADFLKTSTGKAPVSATPEAVGTMLSVIRTAGRPVGIKPSGGIRTLAEAQAYLDLADRIMGPDWATPATFRFGATTLFDALVAEIGGPAAP
jgi:deoxyribose-phosphate aldolase